MSKAPHRRQDWSREAALLRPAKLTLAVFDGAPPIDLSRPWVPERLLPLFGSRSLGQLSDLQRLRYNHSYARQLLAEFIWLERYMILAPIAQLGGAPNLDPNVSLVLRSFISDETNHVASFSRLERLAIKANGASVSLRLFNPPWSIRTLAAFAGRLPVTFTFWTTVIQAFEEHAVEIGQAYMRDEAVDPLFQNVFVAHARDEARHCRVDGLLTAWLRPKPGGLWNSFNERMANVFQSHYRSVKWGLDGPIRELTQVHGEVAGKMDEMIAEAEAIRRIGLPRALME